MGITLAVFEQVFYPVDLRNKLPLNTNQLTCGSMLHVSSFVLASFIASDDKKTPFHENMQPKPVDPYGIAKKAGEDVLKNLATLPDFLLLLKILILY